MASTRDKRMKTDSPTPAQSTESTTPTTKASSAIKLKRMSRSRSGMLSSGKLENEEENDSVGLSEDTVSSTASIDNAAKQTNTRAKRQLAKEEKETESNGDAKGEEDSKDTKTNESPGKRVTKSQVLKNKATILTSAMARRSAMLKRSSLPLPAKASLRNATRRSSGIKGNDSPKPKEETVVTPKKGKVTRKTAEKKDNEEEEEHMEAENDEKIETLNDSESQIEIKQEKLDSKSADIQNIRRSTRQRKSTIKDRDSPFTRRSQARDKSESKRDSVSPALSSASIKTEKDSSKVISISVDTTNETSAEKDPSLSPELVSEELDTESVQHLYDKPDFLENNLGIEKDPKLGVKVQEKTKTIVETALITVVMKKDEEKDNKKEKEDENLKDKKEEEKKTEVAEDKVVDEKKEEAVEKKVVDEKEVKMEEKEVEKKEEVKNDVEEKMDTEVSAEVTEKVEETKADEKVEPKADEKVEPKADEKAELKADEKVEPKVDEKVVIEERPKEQEKVEEVNGEKMEVDEVKVTEQTEIAESKKEEEEEKVEKEDEIKEETEVKKEEIKEETVTDMKKEEEKVEKVDEKSLKTDEKSLKAEEKVEESPEDNKENNNSESSAKSTGSNSPRSEDRLKIMNETNTQKIELNESAEQMKLKENHFKSLGLFTHKAAEEAKLAKEKRKKELALQIPPASRKAKKDSSDHSSSKTSGTLKTIIKLNRSDKDKRRTRMPLKITFQKKNRDKDSNGSSNSAENSFYTIQNEKDTSSSESHGAISRKSHNRSYNHEQVASSNDQNKNHEPVVNKELEQSLVIPEKASSFKVHPERICKDQCFYCGGKFGLYDTPCHIAQIKSTERQNKILESEEKLTKDSCLCDACFRHVDRRANCPSYRSKQRPSASSQPSTSTSTSPVHQSQNNQNNFDRTFGICNVIDCNENAVHSIRKKWVIKMKEKISKIFQINLDLQPTNTNISICEEHFAALSHIMVCAMCKRKLPKNHIFYINQDIARLENLIAEQGLHLKLSNSTFVVCKLCYYYNNLLFKPPEPKTQKADFIRKYTKKLMKHNSIENDYTNRHVVQIDDDDVQEVPIRNDDLTLTIKNGKIQPKKLPDRFTNNKEVTITMKGSPAPSGHMLLDNDVMVGYDVPMLENCPSPPAHTIRNPNYKGPITTQTTKPGNKGEKKKDDNNEMARALKSNPNISMRELFPGEEEMALQINLPFNSTSTQRTPEGWFKVQMTVQYDDVTKALWENLQRPYGNQSSFIRHLVLLEKYYRNGDLILSQSASNSAVSYSESVRNRLRSYDNIPSSIPAATTANLSNEVTIIPAPKAKKTNDSVSITPQSGTSLLKRKSSQSEMGSPKQKVAKIDETAPKKSSPPELISFNQKSSLRSKSKDKEPTNTQPISNNNSNNTASTTTAASTTTTTNSNTTTSQSGSTNGSGNSSNGNVVVLPDTLTPQERKQCSKSWRPTLIPITGSGQLLNSNGPLYQTADGRKLPELVQVMSGGKPYHISIYDYNKMCIIRREKLKQQLTQKARPQGLVTQNQNSTAGNSPNSTATTNSNSNNTTNSIIPASTTALSIIPMPKEKDANASNFKPATTSTPSNIQKKQLANIPNQILEQNSLIPINSSEQNGKKHQNGGLPPPLTQTYTKTTTNTNNMLSMCLPPALSALSKTVNALQPTSSHAAQLAAWNTLWNDNEININSDNMAALAQIANLANLGTNLMEPSAASLLSKIPKSLTVIPQAKTDRRSSDEQKNNSAST